MEEGRASIVERKGHQYYVVDQDLSRGDKRSDGPALSNFFIVEGGSTIVNNVRESHRLKNRVELASTFTTNESYDSTTDEQLEYSLDAMHERQTCIRGGTFEEEKSACIDECQVTSS
jgi:hypothetical protein